MYFYDPATELRMANHHIREIAADVDATRGKSTIEGLEGRFAPEQHHRIARLRQSTGTLLVRTGERLKGVSAGTVVPDSQRA